MRPSDDAAATTLASRLELPLLDAGQSPDALAYDAILRVDGDTLSLQATGPGAPGPVAVDFGSGRMRHRRRAGANELLGRAVGVGKKPELRVLDATAGLGRDAFVLADLGCIVELCERHPVIAAMLEAGLAHALTSDDAWLREVAGRMHLSACDARALPGTTAGAFDTIYLDPMFATRSKRAAVKKEMALFQALLADDQDEGDADELLTWALSQAVARVVVKRPLKGAVLGGSPSHSIRGRAVRFDVYAFRGLG